MLPRKHYQVFLYPPKPCPEKTPFILGCLVAAEFLRCVLFPSALHCLLLQVPLRSASILPESHPNRITLALKGEANLMLPPFGRRPGSSPCAAPSQLSQQASEAVQKTGGEAQRGDLLASKPVKAALDPVSCRQLGTMGETLVAIRQ